MVKLRIQMLKELPISIEMKIATQMKITICLIVRFAAMTHKLLNLNTTINKVCRIHKASLHNKKVVDLLEAAFKKATLKTVKGFSLRLMTLMYDQISAANKQVPDQCLSLTDSQRFRRIERMTTILKLEKVHPSTLLLLEESTTIDQMIFMNNGLTV